MRYYSYIVARDYGFAPNPFWGSCTLATCKPKIRKHARIGDWIFGTGAKANGVKGRLVFAMQVSEKLTFDQYWADARFRIKRPVMNGSLKQMYGDNIYHRDVHGLWLQENSHHALEDGSINQKNLKTDTGGEYVLISHHFFYFGKSSIPIPPTLLAAVCKERQGEKHVKGNAGPALIQYLTQYHSPGKVDNPLQFKGAFKRYKGR